MPPNKFSQSVSAVSSVRAQSPATFRPKSRPSLPRPESPVRRAQPHAGNTPATGSRQSINMLSQTARLPAGTAGPRYAASPTPAKMGSVRGAPTSRGKPAVNPLTHHANDTRTTSTTSTASFSTDRGSASENNSLTEITQLQAIIAEKNAKIASLTADFDAHRADFRSTLDTLELASTETERVYEKKVEDLLEERRLLVAQGEDVDSVARQLRGLEEVVQELEEGLEDARRGEAEARGEVEFLRGEVERVRAELRRERERNVELVREVEDHRRDKAAGRVRASSKALNGTNGDEGYGGPARLSGGGAWSPSKTRSKALMSPEPQNTSQSSPASPEVVLQENDTAAHEDDPANSTPRPIPKRSAFAAADTTAAHLDASGINTDHNDSSVTTVNPPASDSRSPAASKDSPINDPTKWCALCEQDGHDSISCPLDSAGM